MQKATETKKKRGITNHGGEGKKENDRDMNSRLLRFNPVHAVVYMLAVLPILQVYLVIGQGFSGTRGIQLSQSH
jgi:hypothetical protein